MKRYSLVGISAAITLIATGTALTAQFKLNDDSQRALESITADSLKGHVSFLASDALEGRGTPSKGLDIAAEYIASQFRRAGLEPAGDDGYFQTTTFTPRRSAEKEQSAGVKVRNVIGVLRGSDPKLKDTYVIVSAHYDHLGIKTTGEGDLIYNGANDDGSGTASVVEMAVALSKLKQRPKRSIVFMTFYGEERGLVGSRYYGAHPIFPLKDTVAMVNLEQVGRTDDTEGPRVGAANITGFDYSTVGDVLIAAGKLTGVKLEKHPVNSDRYFGASDNQALADQGVPAHTISVAYEYPDYHRVGDHWDKLDYANMAKIVKMATVGVLMIASDSKAPTWNDSNAKTARYVKAWKKLMEDS